MGDGRYAMMVGRAATTGLPRHDQRLRDAAPAADEQPGQGHGDPRPTPPDHRAATPTRRSEGAIAAQRPNVAGGPVAPVADAGSARNEAARAAGHGPALASESARPSPRDRLPPQAAGPSAHATVHPHPGDDRVATDRKSTRLNSSH